MSSIAPLTSIKIEAEARKKGVDMLDAPVSGGETGAIEGTLSIMVGGEEKVFKEVKEILQVMGRSAVKVGEIGAGQFTKLVNQILVGIHLQAMAEAFVFGKIAGERAAQRALAGETHRIDISAVSKEVERLGKLTSTDGEDIGKLQHSLKTVMWKSGAIIRNEKGLKEALEEITSLKERFRRTSPSNYQELTNTIRLGNMLFVSEMVVRSALLRTESRGAHYRSDHPKENNMEWLKNIMILKKDGEMSLSTAPVDLYRMFP